MINKIFWDNDECLVSAYQVFSKNEETDFDVGIKVENDVYNLKINPYAWKMLEFSRKLVGAENVWMITTGTRDYAEAVIQVCDFGFPSNQILTREDIYGMIHHIRFDPEFINPYKNKNNVLIDNLTPRHNEEKMMILGIDCDNYCKVPDYYGVASEQFEEIITDFLNERTTTN